MVVGKWAVLMYHGTCFMRNVTYICIISRHK